MKRHALLLLALLFAVSGCAAFRSPDARPAVREELLVSDEWLAAHLGDPSVVVLHVGRDRSVYDAGHVPGAHFLPLGEIVVERGGMPNELPPVEQLERAFERAGVSDGRRVVLYGDLEGLAAGRAFFTLDYLGHPQAALLDGGLEVWRANGRALSTEAPAARPGALTPRPRPEIVVPGEWLRAQLGDPGLVLIDARPSAQYTGAEPGEGVARPGHIPGAHSIFWKTAFASDERPLLRDAEALRASYEAAGAGPGKTVVTYCRTGMQASHAYFVARYLGYDTRMYDASFLEWSRMPAAPVEP